MLVLSRKAGQRIMLGDDITIIVNRVAGNRVTLGVEAPEHVRIVRSELERLVTEFDDPACETGLESSHEAKVA